MSTDFSPWHGAQVCWQMPIDFHLCHVPEVPEVPQVPKKDVPQVPEVPEVPAEAKLCWQHSYYMPRNLGAGPGFLL